MSPHCFYCGGPLRKPQATTQAANAERRYCKLYECQKADARWLGQKRRARLKVAA